MIMAKIPEHLAFVKYREERTDMSDVILARRLVEDIGGRGRVSETLYEAYKTLRNMFPHTEEPHKQWTERRLRSWWNRESENVMHWQMLELYQAAAKKKEERALLAEARREHAEFIAKTARIRAFLEHQDEAFNCVQIEGMGHVMGRVDCSRVEGE